MMMPDDYQIIDSEPCGHRLIVKLLRPEEKSQGGIIFIDTEKTKYASEKAEVIQVGKQAFKVFDNGEPWCKVGDIVLIAKYSGRQMEENGFVYRIINDEDVFLRWENNNE